MFERNPPQLCHHDNRDTVGSHCCETALDMQMLKKHASLSVLISQSLSTPQSQLWILCSAFSKLSLDFILKEAVHPKLYIWSNSIQIWSLSSNTHAHGMSVGVSKYRKHF